MPVDELLDSLRVHWSRLKQDLLSDSCGAVAPLETTVYTGQEFDEVRINRGTGMAFGL
jgi:hypothetical protein